MGDNMTEMEKRHEAFCRRAAAEGMVLLKNEGKVLPVPKGHRIALYGGGALYTIRGGLGSGDVNCAKNVSVFEGLSNAGYKIITGTYLNNYKSIYEKAREEWEIKIREIAGPDPDFEALFTASGTYPFEMPAGMKITGEHVSDWDRINTPAFYVISRVSGEGADRKARKGDYYLTDTEKSELEAICGIYNKVVVILNVGGVIDLKFTDELNIRGILLMSLAGMEGGNALADIVSGRFSPSGKLSDTWAMDYQDYPSSKNFSHNNGNTAREFYTDGIYVGYRYFDTFNVLPRYAFGYGMSYTSFSVRYPEDAVLEGTTVSLKAEVVNTGRAVGRETVMLFVSCPWGLRKKELKRLTDFKKTRPLYPSKSQKLTLSFDLEQLLSYHTGRASWYLDAGDYLLLAGTSSDNVTVAGRLRLNNTVWMAEGTNICPLHDALKEIEPEEDRFKNIRIVKDDKAIDINEAASELENTWADRKKHLSEEKPGLEEINERFASLAFAEDTDTNQLSFIEEADHPADGGESDNSKDIKRLISILSLKEKAAIVCGQPGGNDSIIGAAAFLVPGAAGETSGILESKGIGQIVLADGPAGLRIQESTSALPIGTLLSQTFDENLLKEAGEMIAEEMRKFKVSVWLAPGMNIHRNPLCGRNFEYYSEDPFLSGKMASAITLGVQKDDRLSVTIKHFACNNQEDNRRGVSAVISERALREIYLKGFEIAVREARPRAIMTSYNKINGVHSANNYDLCTVAARGEWGFEGLIMTDWITTNSNGGSSAAKCIAAGNDLIMPGSISDIREIIDAVEQTKDQRLSEKLLDQSASRVLELVLKTLKQGDE